MNLSFVEKLQENTTILKLLVALAIIVVLVVLWLIRVFKLKKAMTLRDISLISLFAALSFILYFLKISLPIFPSFLEMNLSMLPIIIIGFILGPIEGVTVVLLRTCLKLPFTSTACVGELADMLIGITVVLTSSIIYDHHKTKKGAIISLVFGSISWVLISVLTNWLINIPFYLALYFNNDVNVLIGLLSMIPNVNESNYMIKYLLFAVVPFNLILSAIVSLITFLIYKKISFLCKKHIEK